MSTAEDADISRMSEKEVMALSTAQAAGIDALRDNLQKIVNGKGVKG